LNTLSKIHGVHSSGDRLATLLEDSSSQNGGGCGTISSLVVSLRSDLLDQTSTDVVVSIGEIDFFGNSNTILGDFWSTEGLVDDNISSSGSESDLNGISEHITTFKHESSGLGSEFDLLTEISLWHMGKSTGCVKS